MTLLSSLPSDISTYGYPALLAVCIAEGPVGTIVGGFLASRGLLDARAVFGISLLGDIIGDLLYYWAGRHAVSWRWLQRRMDTRRETVDVLRARLLRSPAKALFFGKWSHAAGFAVLMAAGAFRMRLVPFVGYNLIATVPKSALLVFLGIGFGAAYQRIDRIVLIASIVMLALLVAGTAWSVRRAKGRTDAHRDLHG